jgi:uncharacterized protein (TIGR03435 family)
MTRTLRGVTAIVGLVALAIVMPTTASTQVRAASSSALTLRELTSVAYGVPVTDVEGGPAWADTVRFDISTFTSRHAQPGSGALQALLTHRFKLAVRVERTEQPIYRLVNVMTFGKPSSGLALSRCLRADVAATAPQTADEALERMMAPPCRPLRLQVGSSMSAEGMTLAEFATELSKLPEIARVVRDETGNDDVFDLELHWNEAGSEALRGHHIAAALQRQLGLRLESDRGVVETVVIEGADLPAEE